METGDPIADLHDRLPRHWRLLDALRRVVEADDRLRWSELGCSLGAGRGDELSDVDVGIGYRRIEASELDSFARSIATLVGFPVDSIVHRMPGWPDDVCRVAAEYPDGVQLDLVLMPEQNRDGLPPSTIALADKDGRLAYPFESRAHLPPTPEVAQEWVFLGWWALSAADKYVTRRSWFEAVEAIAEARRHALSLFACGNGVPYPWLGLVSLLDYPPYELPERLAQTYCSPADPAAVIAAMQACAELLHGATQRAASNVGASLISAMADTTLERMARH